MMGLYVYMFYLVCDCLFSWRMDFSPHQYFIPYPTPRVIGDRILLREFSRGGKNENVGHTEEFHIHTSPRN